MKKKVWPFWVTGTFWALILLGMMANGLFHALNMPNIDLGLFSGSLFVFTMCGISFSVFKIKSGVIGLGIFLLLFGVFGIISALVTSSDLATLITFVNASVIAALLGIPNLIALKA